MTAWFTYCAWCHTEYAWGREGAPCRNCGDPLTVFDEEILGEHLAGAS